MSYIGFISKINSVTRKKKSGNGTYTLHSLRLVDKDGNEVDGWFNNGFDPIEAKQGDYVKFEAAKSDYGQNNYDIAKGSLKVSKNPPAAPAEALNDGPAKPKSGGGGGGSQSRNIHYQNSRTAALGAVGLLLEHGGLQLPATQSKAGAANRYELIVGAIDKLTVKYFNDLESFRLLETVADTFEFPQGDGDLPDSEPDAFDDNEPDDPFGDGEDDDFE